jgi:cytochrome c oxidase assembly protein subunit 15
MLALVAVIMQGILGGLTVLYLLPTPISVAHATLAQSFFSLTIILALVTSKGWTQHEASILPLVSRTRRFALLATGGIFLQLVLGAWMRHSAAGLAIPDFPLSYGGLLPPAGPEGLAFINDQRIQWFDLPPVAMAQVWVHFAHRLGAILAGGTAIACTLHILRAYRTEARLREPAIVMFILVLVQLLLGDLTVWTGKGVQVATAHVATGALLLGTSVLVSVRTFHLYRASVPLTEPFIAAQPAKP